MSKNLKPHEQFKKLFKLSFDGKVKELNKISDCIELVFSYNFMESINLGKSVKESLFIAYNHYIKIIRKDSSPNFIKVLLAKDILFFLLGSNVGFVNVERIGLSEREKNYMVGSLEIDIRDFTHNDMSSVVGPDGKEQPLLDMNRYRNMHDEASNKVGKKYIYDDYGVLLEGYEYGSYNLNFNVPKKPNKLAFTQGVKDFFLSDFYRYETKMIIMNYYSNLPSALKWFDDNLDKIPVTSNFSNFSKMNDSSRELRQMMHYILLFLKYSAFVGEYELANKQADKDFPYISEKVAASIAKEISLNKDSVKKKLRQYLSPSQNLNQSYIKSLISEA